jgi:hypothetical protein
MWNIADGGVVEHHLWVIWGGGREDQEWGFWELCAGMRMAPWGTEIKRTTAYRDSICNASHGVRFATRLHPCCGMLHHHLGHPVDAMGGHGNV